MENEKEKQGKGRPFKMQNWLSVLNEVLQDEASSFLTDKDLLAIVNNKLPDEDKINRRTLEYWKAGKYHPNEEIGKDFIKSIEFATANQKLSILKKILNGDSKTWQNLAWILERRFPEEYSLRNYNINKNEQQNIIHIQAGSEEQKVLIDSILKVDFQEIKPEMLKAKNEVEPQNNNDEKLQF